MSTPAIVLLAVVVFLSCAQVGGGVYEYLVLDPVWPERPAIIQPRHGGVSRRRFWIPAHTAFEAAFETGDPAVIERTAAERWTRRSLLRIPLDAITCAAVPIALVAAA